MEIPRGNILHPLDLNCESYLTRYIIGDTHPMVVLEASGASPICLPADIPSIESIIFTLRKVREKRSPEGVKKMHAHISSYGLDSHLALGNYLLSLYVECGHLSDAEQVFRSSVERNEYSWTSLIQGYVEGGKPKLAFEMLDAMKEEGFSPSTYTFVALESLCGRQRQ